MRQWLFDIRKKRNFTMAEVAEQSNISESYYSMIENGVRNLPVSTAKKIASVLGFDWVQFYNDEPKAANR